MRLVHSDFIQKIIQTFLTQVFLLGINFLSAILISRALGPELRGIYAVAMTISMIGMQFGNLGLHSANTYFVAKDPKILPAVVGNTLATSLILGFFCSLMAWLFCHFYGGIEHIEGTLLYLTIFWIPLGLTSMLFQNILLGIHEVKAFNKSEILYRVFHFLLVVPLILSGLKNLSLLFFVNYLSMTFSLFYIFHRIKKALPGNPYFSVILLKNSLSYALRVYLSCFFAFFVTKCDILFVKYYLDFEQTGYYSVANSAIEIISMFPITIATLLFPKLSAMESESKKLNYLKKTALFVFLGTTFIAICLFFLAKPVIYLVYGQAYSPAIPIFRCLLPGMVFLSMVSLYSSYFGSIGLPLVSIFSPLAVLLIKISLNHQWVKIWGVQAIAISSTLGYALMFLISFLYLRYRKDPVLIEAAKLSGPI